MSLITPDFGLFFWMVIAFGLVVFVLAKFAWKPILSGLNAREAKIAEALDRAKAAQDEIAKLEVQNAQMARDAQAERERLVAEAKAMREKILEQAHEEAKKQAEAYMTSARLALAQEEAEIRKRMRHDVARIAILTSERILREHFSNPDAQKQHIDRLLDEMLPQA